MVRLVRRWFQCHYIEVALGQNFVKKMGGGTVVHFAYFYEAGRAGARTTIISGEFSNLYISLVSQKGTPSDRIRTRDLEIRSLMP